LAWLFVQYRSEFDWSIFIFHCSYTCNGMNDLKDLCQYHDSNWYIWPSLVPYPVVYQWMWMLSKWSMLCNFILLWHLITHLRQAINMNAFSVWNSADIILLLQNLVSIIVSNGMHWRATYGLIKEKFTTDWMVQGLNPSGDKIFCTHPDWAWGPTSLLYNKYQVFFPQVKHPGHGINHPPPSGTEVKESVQVHLYSPFGPSWTVLVWMYLLLHKENSQWLVLWDQIYAFITSVYDLETGGSWVLFHSMYNVDVYKQCMTVFTSILYKHVPKNFMSEH